MQQRRAPSPQKTLQCRLCNKRAGENTDVVLSANCSVQSDKGNGTYVSNPEFLLWSFSCILLGQLEGKKRVMYVTVICCQDAIFIFPFISWLFSLFFLPRGLPALFTICNLGLTQASRRILVLVLDQEFQSNFSCSQQLIFSLLAFSVKTRLTHIS